MEVLLKEWNVGLERQIIFACRNWTGADHCMSMGVSRYECA